MVESTLEAAQQGAASNHQNPINANQNQKYRREETCTQVTIVGSTKSNGGTSKHEAIWFTTRLQN